MKTVVIPSIGAWDNVPTEIPATGNAGQILTKKANGFGWENPKKLYQHHIRLRGTSGSMISDPAADGMAVLVTDSDTPFTFATLAAYLYDNGFTDDSHFFAASGEMNASTKQVVIVGMYATTQQSIKLYGRSTANSYTSETGNFTDMTNFADTVIRIV